MTTPTAPGTSKRDSAVEGLIERLVHLKEHEDRGALSALRRSLGKEPGEVAEACSIVERFLGESAPADRVAAFYLVAGLFALHPVHSETNRNLGASLREIRFREATKDEDQGVLRRLLAVLDARPEALDVHLRSLVTLLHSRSPETPIDYVRLARQIQALAWNHPDRWVQHDWANGFWGYVGEEPAGDNTSDGAAPESDDNDTTD